MNAIIVLTVVKNVQVTLEWSEYILLTQTARIVLIQSTKDFQHPTQSSFQIDIPKGERKHTDRHMISTTNGYKGWGVIGELQTCCSIFKTPTLDLHFPLLLCSETTRPMQSP